MPAAAPFAALGGAIAAGIVGGPLGLAIGLGSAIGAGLLASLAKSGKLDSQGRVEARGHQVNTTSSSRPLPLAYGICKLGVNQTFKQVENPYLHIIGEICEGPIGGIVRQDDTLYSTTGSALPTSNPPLVYFDDQLFSSWDSDLVHLEFFDGASNQSICSTLQSATSKWDQTLRYTSYLYIRLKFDPDAFKSIPNITVVIKGAEIYDPITTVTAHTNNPAICIYDYLTRSSQRGGLGIAANRINTTSISDAKDYCAAKNWKTNMPLITRQAAADNLRLLLNCCRGDVIYTDNEFKLKCLDLNYESTVMALTENDVIDGTLKIQQPDAIKRPNAVRVTHLSEDKQYKADDFIKVDKTAMDAEGDYREAEIKLYGLTNQQHAQSMANYHLERLRWNKTVSFVAGNRAMALEPLDLITLTHDLPGWTTRELRVLAGAVRPDHTVALECIEEDSSLYDDTYNLTSHNWHDTDLPNPLEAPPSVTAVSASEVVYDYRGRSFTRWEIDFSAPADTVYPFWSHAEIWLQVGSGGTWRYMTTSQGNYQVDPVQEDEYYALRMRSVSVFGQKEDLSSAYTVATTISGAGTGPSSLSSLTAIGNGDSVSIYATPLDEADIDGYEIRRGSAWNGGLFVSYNKSPTLRLNGVRPGTHTFWCAAKSNNGQYSSSPQSANVVVYIPPGYSELATYGSWSFTFDNGSDTHDNTENTTYDSEDCLICSHTAGVLTGTWTSYSYDLNSIVKVRVWGDFRVTFVSSDTVWTALGAFGTPWNIAASDGDTWQELFEPSAAPQLTATLRYKQLVGDSWSEMDWFEILCGEVEARYISVVVTITDPNADSQLYLRELNMWAWTGPQETS